MYKVNDYVVYKKNVCKIKEIKKNKITNIKCYVLTPIDDESLTIEIPIENSKSLIRDIISKDEVLNIIDKIFDIDIISNINDKLYEAEYKNLLSTGKHEDLIKIIKTTYLRNEERIKNKKKIGEKDDTYFNKAERLLYNEFSIALNMTFDDTKEFIIKTLEEKNTTKK